jgi:hypothetical protein
MRDGNDLLVLMLSNFRCLEGRVVRRHMRPMTPLHCTRSAMRLHSYRDESHSRQFDLIGGDGHPWSIDLVSVAAAGILFASFACALVAYWID